MQSRDEKNKGEKEFQQLLNTVEYTVGEKGCCPHIEQTETVMNHSQFNSFFPNSPANHSYCHVRNKHLVNRVVDPSLWAVLVPSLNFRQFLEETH
jgi:hypothetical protein